ncbi:MAG: anthranilate synthase component I family protein, partial [Chloroflexi bacterium]|nr:anthranilate synthase component I family protein [Chloroflexota bacterium]
MPPSARTHDAAASAVEPLSRPLAAAPGLPDLLTAFLDLPYPALLDSALLDGKLGRYSYLTADPFLVIRSKGRRVEVERTGGTTAHLEADPFLVLRDLLRRYRLSPVPTLPPFQGGALGYLAYELGHHLEKLPHRAADDLGLPEMNVALYDWAIARDHARGSTWAIATGFPAGGRDAAAARLEWIEGRLREGHPARAGSGALPVASGLVSNFSRDAYLASVRKVKECIVAGDIYQVNLSQRFEAAIACTAWDLYRRLRQVNPAPFAAYLQYPEVSVLSASPEEFLRLERGRARSRPMKGTRPRGVDAGEDAALASKLQASAKDRAENVMIVDLVRSDLGKVCVPGTVQVPELFAIESYPTVLQMVSTVSGQPRPGVDAVDLLRACFPGGSVTGAPKIRALEIIDELEPTQRSVYCGAIGYIGFDGSLL